MDPEVSEGLTRWLAERKSACRWQRPSVVVCSACGRAAELPGDRDHTGLWDAGWRWKGGYDPVPGFVPRRFLYSCPACPSVLPQV